MNLSTKFCGIDFPNPTVLASGYLGVTGASLARCVEFGSGGVTSKTLFLDERKGHPNPTVLTFQGGVINAVGLSGEGIKHAKGEFEKYKKLAGDDAPMIASIGGRNIKELVQAAELMSTYPVDMLELNFSCPNVDDEMGRPIACDMGMTGDATAQIRKITKLPISVKVSPNVPDVGIIAQAAEANGADAITAVNTMGPGMLIDINMRKPVLANKVGGVSGHALKPIAVKCVYEIYEKVKLPIIGTGGIIQAKDAIEMLMAGATLLGIGSAIIYYDMKAFNAITDGIKKFMEEESMTDISELVGLAHGDMISHEKIDNLAS